MMYPIYWPPAAIRRHQRDFDTEDLTDHIEEEFHRMNRHMRELEQRFEPRTPKIASLLNRDIAILPIYIDRDGHRFIRFHLDASGFQPEDIHIKVSEGRLTVTGKHEEKTHDFAVHRQFSRTISIPEGTHLEEAKSRLGLDGILNIEAPFFGPNTDKRPDIAIRHEPEVVEKLEEQVIHEAPHNQAA